MNRKSNEPNALAWALAYHEGSHALFAHLIFGDGSIKQVDFSLFGARGSVHFHKAHTFIDSDLLRLPISMAGDVGTKLYASQYVKQAKSQYTESFQPLGTDDAMFIKEIVKFRGLKAVYLKQQKDRLKTVMLLPVTKRLVAELASLLYAKVYNTYKVRTIMKGAAVHKQIKQTLAAIAKERQLSVGRLEEYLIALTLGFNGALKRLKPFESKVKA